MLTNIQTGTSVLRPRARLIKTIGEELISNDVVAVVELIKNSYDADASIITITFSGDVEKVKIDKKTEKIYIKQTGSSILITDDGTGMSLDIIKKAWMEPATIMKKDVKLSSGKGRRNTGEKGIGRFASAKLSSDLKIITKEKNDNEVVVDFHWADFTSDDLYLDQVETKWEVRVPTIIVKNGTNLYLDNLNSEWDSEKIRLLRVALSRLVNPLTPIPDFLIELNVPKELGDLSGLISSPDSINNPDYSIKGNVDEDGFATIIYSSKNITESITITKELSKSLTPIRKPLTGPFNFEFRVWDREKESLDKLAKEIGTTTKNVREDLNELSGVSIYRDNFRVLPYGEPKNDWLRLNARRVNNPTMRLSDNQIIGYISISLDFNSALKDQSNREGIVDSKPFEDLQEMVSALLNELEVKRYEERPRKEDNPNSQESIYSKFSISAIEEQVVKKLPNDKEVLKLVHDTQTVINEGVHKVQEVLSRYRRLSTLGLLIDSVLHDGGHFLLNIDGEARLLEAELKSKDKSEELILQYVKSIQEQRKVLAQLFKRLEPFGGRKRGRPTTIIIEEAIRNVFAISNLDIKRLKISLSLPESENKVTIDNGELQMILINLLQNSIYWLGTVDYERKITVCVERSNDDLAIIFSDNGPGIPENQTKLIFDPYFSTRKDGVGLGLTIVGELVSEYNGDFYLLENGPLDGATFKIIFKKRI